ncbi:hypothetical protein COMA2_10308 [Candidatus Nitrospira nitrificans]|uniref:Uncharacterized protein n=1 Tax=Candidatus Nitrospira nitrificans TaxID=1742973 RepID=A0A0S4L9L3_9BACT|nr:hypothetical protein COMA2_10308 [Candidatus Nitrospira nitrificans]
MHTQLMGNTIHTYQKAINALMYQLIGRKIEKTGSLEIGISFT